MDNPFSAKAYAHRDKPGGGLKLDLPQWSLSLVSNIWYGNEIQWNNCRSHFAS